MAHTDRLNPSSPAHGGPLRICIPAETYLPEMNGAATFTNRLATGLAARGHEVHVIAPSATGSDRHDVEDGVHVHRIRSHRWMPHPTWTICMPWETAPRVAGLLDDIRPDVVHTQAHFVLGRYAITEAKKRGIPVVGTNHFMPDNVRPYVRVPRLVEDAGVSAAWWDLRRTFGRVDVLTVPTQLAADLLTVNRWDRPVRAVSCGIDLSRFAEAPSAPDTTVSSDVTASSDTTAGGTADGGTVAEGDPTVLFVGRLSKEKNAHEIVDAIAATDPDLGLRAVIIGAGDQDTVIRDRARELGVEDRIDLRGKVSDAELDAALRTATLFCMPGTAELQSIATLEALAAGRPVVLADAVALPHLCDGENGTLFRPHDTDDLARALSEVAGASAAERARMGEASRRVAARHDIAHTLDTFEGIYRSLI
ncbi:glycosyltransferase [Brevibacterium litoralis]|uniref:glycosyltransferase n=1 Tax=Brevibacterium litoralis TaxID=3138935 RepID=UPI0032EB8128